MDEDRALVAHERVLWLGLDEVGQQADTAWLRDLWDRRGASRAVSVDPSWGLWTGRVGRDVVIVDSAFGLAGDGFRPWGKGPWGEGSPWAWLWIRGFQVVAVSNGGVATIVVPSHRIVQEAERLVGSLSKSGVVLELGGAISVVAAYDPMTGVGTLTLYGCTELGARLAKR